MKKIGIMTFHASHNCGSMLQAFALQKILASLGHEVEIIDFSNKGQKKLYSVLYRGCSLKCLIKNIIILPHLSRIKRTYSNYESFKKKRFNLTRNSYESCSELVEDKLGFDNYICGSDQIWNVTIEDADDAYFLPFVKKHKKIAYAPSFGAKNILKYSTNSKYYAKLISSFDFLSIREKNGQRWVKDLIQRDIPIVLDPTLVADSSIYSDIEKKEFNVPDEYIFYYAPGYSKEINKCVRDISRKYKMPVIVFNSKQYYTKLLWKYGFILPEIEDPESYLYLIKHAKVVITTSFHGTIFSTIYRKNFWTLKNGDMFGDDDRVGTLVTQLGIEERLVPPEGLGSIDILKPFDYRKYEENLIVLKRKSFAFLKKAIDTKYEGENVNY